MKCKFFKKIVSVFIAFTCLMSTAVSLASYTQESILFSLAFNQNHSSNHSATSYTLAEMAASTGVPVVSLAEGDDIVVEKASEESWSQPKIQLESAMTADDTRHIAGFNVPLSKTIKTGRLSITYSVSGMTGLSQRRYPVIMNGNIPIFSQKTGAWALHTGDETSSSAIEYWHDKEFVFERESVDEDWTVSVQYPGWNNWETFTVSKEYLPEITSIGAGSDLIPGNAEQSICLRFNSYTVKYAPVYTSGRSELRTYTVPSSSFPLETKLFRQVEVPNVNLPFTAGSVTLTYENAVPYKSSMHIFLYVDGEYLTEAALSTSSGTVEIPVKYNSTGIRPGSTVQLYTKHLSSCTVTGMTFKKENSPGIDRFVVDLKNSDSFADDAVSVGTVYSSIESYFPFDTTEIHINYTATAADTLTVRVNGASEKTVSVNAGTGTAKIFYDSVFPVDNAVIEVKKAAQDSEIKITDVTFHKENQIWPDKINLDIAYTDYEAALQTSTVFKNNCNIFKSKNAIRYMSYDNTDSATFAEGGVMYAPIDALALAFELYREERDTSYFYRSADNSIELEISKSACVQNAAGDDSYPIKQFAEHFGYSVFESGDYLVIDKLKIRAKEIIENSSVFNSLIYEFGSYTPETVEGTTYYVNGSVSASGNGSEASPFKTIQEAAKRASAGDRVVIKGGTYRETVTPANSGTATNPIIFEAEKGEQVTVSAFDKISGFGLYYDGVYVAKLPVELDFGSDFIMHNGKVLVEGRQPNSHTSGKIYPSNVTSPLWPTKGNILTPVSGTVGQSETEIQNGVDNGLRGATYITFKEAAWNLAYGKVLESDRKSFSMSDLISMVSFGIPKSTYSFGYLTNSRATLDLPGEWYAADKVLYIIPPAGVNGEDLVVEAKQRYTSFNLTDKSCIQVKNINTIGGSVLMAGDAKLNVVNGGTHKYVSHFTYPLNEDGITYEDHESENNPSVQGKAGEYLGGLHNAFLNCTVDTSAGSGIILAGKYGYVSGNTILDADYSGMSMHSGISIFNSPGNEAVTGGGHNIRFNTVCKSGRSALRQDTKRANDSTEERLPLIGSEIAYNDFSYSNILARDTGIVYNNSVCTGNDLVKTQLHHNVIHDSVYNGRYMHPAGDSGIYYDNCTGNEIAHRNIIYYTGDFRYDHIENLEKEPEFDGSETLIYRAVIIQGFSQWERKYSTVEKEANMFDENREDYPSYPKLPQFADGFDKTNSSNYPDGKIFNYGA